jgi:hypothetical protein
VSANSGFNSTLARLICAGVEVAAQTGFTSWQIEAIALGY